MPSRPTLAIIAACLIATLPTAFVSAQCSTMVLAPLELPSGAPGSPYDQTITQTGAPAASFAITAGALPAGTSLDAAGQLSGTPTIGGTSIFTVTATDANGCTSGRTYRLAIGTGAVPTATLVDVDQAPLLGDQITFTARFDNTSTTETGFGPYLDLFLPSTGADGSTVGPPYDGIVFVSAASVSGLPLSHHVLTFGSDSNGNGSADVQHPFARDELGAFEIIEAPAGFFEGDELVVIELPYGSHAPAQPPLDVLVTVEISALADIDTALPIELRAGFRLGNQAEDNPTADPPVLGPPDSVIVQPTILTMEMIASGPDDKTATGPNYPRSYTIVVDIADGQTLTGFHITDSLPNNVSFLSFTATPGGYTATTPSPPGIPYNVPDNDVVLAWSSMTGGPGSDDVMVVIEFFVPFDDADGNPIVPCGTGSGVSINDARIEGHWVPLDIRDPELDITHDPSPDDHILMDKCVTVHNDVQVVVDNGSPGLTPGDILEHTIDFQVSDYHAFNDLVLTDEFSDGQALEGVPTLEVADGHGVPFPYGPSGFLATNYTLAPVAGPDTLELRISAELHARGFSTNGRLVGAAIPVGGLQGGPYLDDPPPFGATRGTVRFRTRVQEIFEADVSPQTPNIDHGDSLTGDVTLSAGILSPQDLTPTGETSGDSDDAKIRIVTGGLLKSIYAVNGNTSLPALIQLVAGDEVTYRFQYSLPSSDIEDLELADYLPQPVFDAFEVATFNAVVSASVPPPGVAKFGLNDTFYAISGLFPALPNAEVVSNRVTFYFGDYQDDQNRPSTIDLLFTVTVGSAAAADGLFVTNHGVSLEESTNEGVLKGEASVPATLSIP